MTRHVGAFVASVLFAFAASATDAAAQTAAGPLRLRASALAETSSPVGLLFLDAEGASDGRLSAEAMVWTGSRDEEFEGDVLVMAVRARDERFGELTLGRFVAVAGALRPLHVDGGKTRVRLPQGFFVDAFGGVPVLAGESRGFDWVVGSRLSRQFGDTATAGVAYLHRRDRGSLADEEVALDASAGGRHLYGGVRASYDLVNYGFSEVTASAGWRPRKGLRVELFGRQLSPERILPATSLFSVLGGLPSRSAGTAVNWRAAPRLDLEASVGARLIDDQLGESARGRAVLRLDDRGAGTVGLQLRREAAPDGAWTGARAALRLPVLAESLTVGLELELVAPDDPNGRGSLWPWALAALRWQPNSAWRAAIAVEARSTPQFSNRIDGMFTLSRAWEVPL